MYFCLLYFVLAAETESEIITRWKALSAQKGALYDQKLIDLQERLKAKKQDFELSQKGRVAIGLTGRIYNDKNGQRYYGFANQAAKSRFVQQIEQEIRQLTSEIAELDKTITGIKNQLYVPPLTKLAVGEAGTHVGNSRVLQAIDDDNVLIYLRAGGQTLLVWLESPDHGFVDDQIVRLNSPIHIVGTQTYVTKAGDERRVLLAVQIKLPSK